ncbi:MAG: Efflux transporter, RND family, MFP subunit [uncultured bacterium]|nr:MAG: Efflux transporter, RND family, MFP subunit [uncultured bacterium]HBR72048.1 hypothetical protein [Candidatus Moranbacteria bacterium]
MSSLKKKLIWIVIIIIVAVGGYFMFRKKSADVVYTTVDVEKGDLFQTVSSTGVIKTVNQTDLSFKVSGRVISLLADVGDSITEGQLLARLDLGSLSGQLSQARNNLQAQKEALKSIKKNPGQYNYDDKEAQRAKIRSYEDAINIVQSQIRDTYMYSPINGIILKRNVDPYETTVANSPTPVFTVGDPNDLVVETNVSESDIAKVQLGDRAKVTFDALGIENVFESEVAQIDTDATVIQDVVYYRVKLRVSSNIDSRLKPGMSANIDIETAEEKNVVKIPLRAIKTEGNKKYVEILKEENATEKVFVETGLEGDEGMTEIKLGLRGGEKVITFVSEK